MSLEAGHFLVLGSFEDGFPLITHLSLEVLADLKVFDHFVEHFLDQDLVDVLVMKLVLPSLVSSDLVRMQNLQDVLLFYYNHLFIVHVKRFLVVHTIQ